MGRPSPEGHLGTAGPSLRRGPRCNVQQERLAETVVSCIDCQPFPEIEREAVGGADLACLDGRQRSFWLVRVRGRLNAMGDFLQIGGRQSVNPELRQDWAGPTDLAQEASGRIPHRRPFGLVSRYTARGD